MRDAIQKAIDGGWGGHMEGYPLRIDIMPSMREPFQTVYFVRNGVQSSVMLHSILLDRTFWQALGKAMGWGRIKYRQSTPRCIRMMSKPTPNRWKKEWHRFVDHIAEGKDVESFFVELLK